MRWIATLLLPVAFAAAAGCNTVKGMGTDLHDMAQNTQTFFEGGTGYPTDSRTPSPASASRSVNRSANAN